MITYRYHKYGHYPVCINGWEGVERNNKIPPKSKFAVPKWQNNESSQLLIRKVSWIFHLEGNHPSRNGPFVMGAYAGEQTHKLQRLGYSPEFDVLDGIGKRLVPFLLVLRVYERVELNDALGIFFEDVFRTIFKTRRVQRNEQKMIYYNI